MSTTLQIAKNGRVSKYLLPYKNILVRYLLILDARRSMKQRHWAQPGDFLCGQKDYEFYLSCDFNQSLFLFAINDQQMIKKINNQVAWYQGSRHRIGQVSHTLIFFHFLNILFLKNRRSEALAKERGCSHTFVLASGKYSAAVFDKLGHKMVSPHFFSSIFIIIDYFDLTGEKCGLCWLRWLQRRASA